MQGNTEEIEIHPSAEGRALSIDRYTFKSVHLKPGTGAPSYDLEISLDGANFFTHTANITGTSDTLITTEDVTNPLPKALAAIRFKTNTLGGGDPKGIFFGHDPV